MKAISILVSSPLFLGERIKVRGMPEKRKNGPNPHPDPLTSKAREGIAIESCDVCEKLPH